MQLSEQDLGGKYWAKDYRRWQASGLVEESDDREVAGKLMSGDGKLEYSAAAELWMRTHCEELEGLRFDFHPRACRARLLISCFGMPMGAVWSLTWLCSIVGQCGAWRRSSKSFRT